MSNDAVGDEPQTNVPTPTSAVGGEAAVPEVTPAFHPSSDARPVSTPPAGVMPPSRASWKPSYVFLIATTMLTVVSDIASKQWVKRHFDGMQTARLVRKIEIVPNYVNVIFATNKGGAWGILQGEQEALRRPFFLVVSVAAIVFILSLYRKLLPGQRALRWGLPLVLGGALGNLCDRIFYGWVIDFIDCYVKVRGDERHWPTFNVADVAICIGVGLMAIDMFTTREKKPTAAAERPPVPPTKLELRPELDAASTPASTNGDV